MGLLLFVVPVVFILIATIGLMIHFNCIYNKLNRRTRFKTSINLLPLETPFILNQTAVMLYQQTYNMYYANLDNSLYYGAACLGYWLLMLLVIGLVNWTKVLFPNFVKKLTSPIVNKWRKYISAPATLKEKRQKSNDYSRLFLI